MADSSIIQLSVLNNSIKHFQEYSKMSIILRMSDYEKKKREAMHIHNIESIMIGGLKKTHRRFNHNHKLTTQMAQTEQSSPCSKRHALSTVYIRRTPTGNITRRRQPTTNTSNQYETQKQNFKIAMRIAQSPPTISSSKHREDWQVLKYYLRVRSKFKKDIEVKSPRIFRLEEMIGFGPRAMTVRVRGVHLDFNPDNQDSLYYMVFKIGNRKYPSRKFSYQGLIKNSIVFYTPKGHKSCVVKLVRMKGTETTDLGRFLLRFVDGPEEYDIMRKGRVYAGSIRLELFSEVMDE